MLSPQFEKKIYDNNIPLSVYVELTYRCNLKCIHCYQSDKANDELTFKEISMFLDEISEMGTLFLVFTGGEPLLREDFWEIASYGKKKNFALYLYTNATLISEEIARDLKKLNFLSVHLSLLGATPEVNDKITGIKGSFSKILKAIEHLKKYRVGILAKSTIIKENFHQTDDLKKLAKELDIELIMSPVLFSKRDGSSTDFYRLNSKQLKSYYRQSKISEIKNTFSQREKTDGLFCAIGKTFVAITPEGKIYPCLSIPYSAGNIRDKSFKEIWNYSNILNQLRQHSLCETDECFKCPAKNYCIRCSGFSIMESGKFFSPSDQACKSAYILKEVLNEGAN